MGKRRPVLKWNYFSFVMGPSVKFVLTIIDVFSNKKWGSIGFPEEKTIPKKRGGAQGRDGKRPYFSHFFSLNPSLSGGTKIFWIRYIYPL